MPRWASQGERRRWRENAGPSGVGGLPREGRRAEQRGGARSQVAGEEPWGRRRLYGGVEGEWQIRSQESGREIQQIKGM